MLASFRDSVEELRRYAGIPISAEFLRQIAQREGKRIGRARETGEMPCGFDLSPSPGAALPRLYVGMDGAFARMVRQEEKQARREKAEKARVKLPPERRAALRPLPPLRPGHAESFREMKLGVFYTQDRKRRHCFATSGDHQRAGDLLKAHARRVQFPAASERIAVADGAVWIETELRRNLPELDMVLLDFYHLSQHVHQAAKGCLGETDEARGWTDARLREFKKSGPVAPLVAMRAWLHQLDTRPKRAAMQGLIAYVEKRTAMLQYPEAIRRGWDIGSGPTEAQCKTHLQRLKLPGTKWDLDNAESMINLMALHASTREWNGTRDGPRSAQIHGHTPGQYPTPPWNSSPVSYWGYLSQVDTPHLKFQIFQKSRIPWSLPFSSSVPSVPPP
jgi:hypothetical protein